MKAGLRRALPLAAALVAALTVTSVSGAGHDMTNIFHLGAGNSSALPTRLESTNSTFGLRVANSSTDTPAHALTVLGSGDEAALQATTASTFIFATAIRGVVGPDPEGGSNTAAVHGSNDRGGKGILGESPSGWGIYGRGLFGVSGSSTSPGGVGVSGSSHGTCCGSGVDGYSANYIGVYGSTSSTIGGAPAVYGRLVNQTPAADAAGVRGHVPFNNSPANGYGVEGVHDRAGVGVRGSSWDGTGVYGLHRTSAGTSAGVHGRTNSPTDLAAGVYGEAPSGSLTAGVYGSAPSGIGALGIGGSYGVVGIAPGYAGLFLGDAHVSGTLTKGAGAFRIDHPLEPETKYLQHSFVESPDMKNVYDGVVTTDRRGFATVRLPRYFQALNRDFRYQLTSLSGLQNVAVAREMRGNRFVVQSEKARSRVSWQVTGIRKDAYANANRIPVEVAKAAEDRRQARLSRVSAR
jgi:hypothetical protein